MSHAIVPVCRSVLLFAGAIALTLSGSVWAQEIRERAEVEARIKSLLDQASKLEQAGRYSDAQRLAREAVEAAEGGLGPEDPVVGDCLGWLGGMLEKTGDYSGARVNLERALAIAEKALGSEAPGTASACCNLGYVLERTGDFGGARSMFERSLAIREKALGPDHPETGISLNGVGMVLQKLGKLREAVPCYERALAIFEKALGPEHPNTVVVMSNLGTLRQHLGDLEDARRLLERALSIEERVLGPNHPRTARSHNNLGTLLAELGDARGEIEHAERALGIFRSALGAKHPETGIAMANLADALRKSGDLKRARHLLEGALEINRKALGEAHPTTAMSMESLGLLLLASGDSLAARELLESALGIVEKSLGADHTSAAVCRQNLSLVLEELGELAQARSLLEGAVAIYERRLGPKHPSTASAMGNLGRLLARLGEFEVARSFQRRALAACEESLGPNHRQTAASLANLAVILQESGDLDAAKNTFERALSIQEQAVGPNLPVSLSSLLGLAHVLHKQGDQAASREYVERAWSILQDELRTLLPAVCSRERLGILRERRRILIYQLSILADNPRATWAAVSELKGAALRVDSGILRLPSQAGEEESALAAALADARRQMARLAYGQTGSATREVSVAELLRDQRRRVEELERKLAGLCPDLAVRASQEATPERILRSLPEGTALLDLLEDRGRLHAWVATPTGEVEYFELGSSATLQSLAHDFRCALETDDEEAVRDTGRKLRDRLGKPLGAALSRAEALFVSPDGALATIPWGLLPEGEGFLVERLPVVCLNCCASLQQEGTGSAGNGLLAVGGVDYSGLDRPFPALAETQGEAELVSRRFHAKFAEAPCLVATGKEGDEGVFRREASKARYVHVATHGFFDLANMRVAVACATRGLSGKSEVPLPSALEAGPDVAGWNPLLLSGLVLAPSKDGDGYLTAEELQDLDLRGVELVVLSACETGKGELAAGEGVLGLSRGLAIAGARQFMLSLWKVSDAETSELMDAFYEGLWQQGLPAEEALRRAQLGMLARDREKGSFRPSTWGAWVLTK